MCNQHHPQKQEPKRKQGKPRIAETISLSQFFRMFPGEAEAVRFFENLFWKDGIPICPNRACNPERKALKAYRVKKARNPKTKTDETYYPYAYRCAKCRKNFTVRTGTALEKSNLPLRKWLLCGYLITTARKGASAMQTSKELGVTTKTARFLLARLRNTCSVDDDIIVKVPGPVEVDEMFIGGLEKNKHSRKRMKVGGGIRGKAVVVGLVCRTTGRFIAKVVPNRKGETLRDFVAAHVEPGATVYTDQYHGYQRLKDDFDHHSVNHLMGEFVRGEVHTNGIEAMWAVLKRGFRGIYHQWARGNTDLYVNEFVFRLNEGSCTIDTIDRIKAMFSKAIGKQMSYKALCERRSAAART